MTDINVELKGPKGPQIKESLLPTVVAGYTRGLAVVYGADAYHATLAASAGEAIVGLIEEDAISLDNPIAVIEHGQAVAQIGGAVTAGAFLSVNATGQLIDTASTKAIVAKALEAGSTAGDFILVFVLGGGAVTA